MICLAAKLDSETRTSEAVAQFRAGVLALKEMTQILGLFRIPPKSGSTNEDRLTPALLDLFVKLRTQVRGEKNYALADQIRNDLAALGVTLEDRAGGTGWKIEGRAG